MKKSFDVIIIGGGAAGLMSGIEAGKRGKKVCIIEHSDKIAEKIRISGGGRCNFTNLYVSKDNFISNNPNFCISALKQYNQYNFIELVKKHKIDFYEKKLGQLFCVKKSQEIIDMLLNECRKYKVTIYKNTHINSVSKNLGFFECNTENESFRSNVLIIASGGLSVPKIGATPFGYEIAQKFNIKVIKTRPGLVPLTFDQSLLEISRKLAGTSINAEVSCGKKSFLEGFLFTHKGLSGPSILQISSYWALGEQISINLIPSIKLSKFFLEMKNKSKKSLNSILYEFLPKKLVKLLFFEFNDNFKEISKSRILEIAQQIENWKLRPSGTEGYRTAEVTLGGVDTNEISSKTMESKKVKGLFFIGEVMDVTGQLGGFNFQWAWSSGYVAGNNV
tara:strand:+ start:172 stop:1344 length:1173 start_codon:yes stop_codon:yes gene_type:complete